MRLEGVESQIGAGADLLEAALALLERPDELYRRSTDAGRRQINQALFEKLHIFRDEVINAALRFPAADLVEAHQRFPTGPSKVTEMKKPGEIRRDLNRASPQSRGDLLLQAMQAGSSSKSYLVGVRGFEPPASTSRTWRANQAALHPVAASEPTRWSLLPSRALRPPGGWHRAR
jgi:site-specific DNA recombinase